MVLSKIFFCRRVDLKLLSKHVFKDFEKNWPANKKKVPTFTPLRQEIKNDL